MANKDVAIRKRQQIEQAGRTMFLWVAIAALVVGMAAVLLASLYQRLVFNQKVINEKNNTASVLRENNETVQELKKNIRILNTNQALLDTSRSDDAEPLSVVLDALPSQVNTTALGASLEQRLLNVDGVKIETLGVQSIDEDSDDEDSDSASSGGDNQISFEFTISTPAGKASALKKVLTNIEKSIRAIDITSLTIEQQSSRITLTVEGRAFYELEKQVELQEKAIRP